jgi:hypothetical protein
MRKSTKLAGLGLAVALTLSGCAAGATTETNTETSADVTSMHDHDYVNNAGSDLRAALQGVLYEHVFLAGAAINQALKDGGDLTAPRTAAAVQALDDNSVAVAALVGSAYPEAEQPFLDSWRSHIPLFVEYTLGKVGNDQAMVDAAVAGLGEYAVSFGQLINSVVPTLPAEAVQAELEMHATTLLAAIDADIAGDPGYFTLLQQSATHMQMTAAALAGGIAADKDIK